MGSRTPDRRDATEWATASGPLASHGTFADAASFGEIVFNCTAGAVSLEALRMAGAQNLRGKVLIDVSNGLDFSRGMPPVLTVCNTDSIGEQIQRAFPDAEGGQGAEHHAPRADDRPVASSRRPRRVRLRQRRRRQGRGDEDPEGMVRLEERDRRGRHTRLAGP